VPPDLLDRGLIDTRALLKIEPAKITLKSPQIAIQGDAMVEVSAPMTKVAGSAVLTLQGGIIKIN